MNTYTKILVDLVPMTSGMAHVATSGKHEWKNLMKIMYLHLGFLVYLQYIF